MDDLKHLEGKAVRSIEQNNSGINSFLIIKFTDDSKLNISGYPHGKIGVAQLDVELEEVKIAEVKNRKIASIEEEFDGTMDRIIINFIKGGKMVVGAFNSKEDATAGLEISVYVENKKKLVGESLDENKYQDGRWGNYIMNSPQYEEEEPGNKDEEEPENKDEEMDKFVKETFEDPNWERDELNLDDVGDEEIRPVDYEAGDLMTAIDNELEIPEIDRAILDFNLRGTGEIISGIPMAKMSNGESILFKINDEIRQIKVSDIISESQKPKEWVEESLLEYRRINSLKKEDILTIDDLGDTLARNQIEQEIARRVFKRYFHELYEKGGNPLVIKTFKKSSKLNLKSFGPGKFFIDYD